MIRQSAAIVLLTALGAFSGLGTGCATPTLPLPPPAFLTATVPNADGLVTITGEVLPEAWVYVINLDLEEGIIKRSEVDGTFTVQIPADPGHYISIFQESGAERGPPFEIRVPAP
ncbi:MAG: hypothetical protein DRJ42_09315 [Deltaproteobacteria bacterium]|nr:MAG: hypothetical protein DRJ42_09315 [Deltaproteobacteria bacterium]